MIQGVTAGCWRVAHTWVKECAYVFVQLFVCTCWYRQWRGGEMFVHATVCPCVLVNLNLKMKMHVCLHVHLLEGQCTSLTFQLRLSARTKAFLQALTCVNLLLTRRDSRGHMWVDRVLHDLLHDLSLSLRLHNLERSSGENKMRPQLNECPIIDQTN